MDKWEPQAEASGPGFQSQLDYSCVILSRSPPLSEPHLFSSNVEQPGSRGPFSAVSCAVATEEGGSVDHLGGRTGSRCQALLSGQLGWECLCPGLVGGRAAFVPLGLTALCGCQGMAKVLAVAHTRSTFTPAGSSALGQHFAGRETSVNSGLRS